MCCHGNQDRKNFKSEGVSPGSTAAKSSRTRRIWQLVKTWARGSGTEASLDGEEVETMTAGSCRRQMEQESDQTTVWGVLINWRDWSPERWSLFLRYMIVNPSKCVDFPLSIRIQSAKLILPWNGKSKVGTRSNNHFYSWAFLPWYNDYYYWVPPCAWHQACACHTFGLCGLSASRYYGKHKLQTH